MQKCALPVFYGVFKENTMSTDLKFSLVTTLVVLGLIVAGAFTAILH